MKVYLVRSKCLCDFEFHFVTLNVKLAAFGVIDINVYFIQFSKIIFIFIIHVQKFR